LRVAFVDTFVTFGKTVVALGKTEVTFGKTFGDTDLGTIVSIF